MGGETIGGGSGKEEAVGAASRRQWERRGGGCGSGDGEVERRRWERQAGGSGSGMEEAVAAAMERLRGGGEGERGEISERERTQWIGGKGPRMKDFRQLREDISLLSPHQYLARTCPHYVLAKSSRVVLAIFRFSSSEIIMFF